MKRRLPLVVYLSPVVIVLVVGLVLLIVRCSEAAAPTVGLTAEAVLVSEDGGAIGTVAFRQTATGVLIMADIRELAPGGHAFIVHEVGACTPDFRAAGDHFNPTGGGHGFIHSTWKRGESGGAHGGDLPNLYAGSDGAARADFFTDGITLDTGPRHSIFDADGSAIIVHERPDSYGTEESDTGDRVACGVIQRT
ncbi:MAG: superoxide dismutase family protein [Chloroflexi bacterium]|nr:superoxide dismutase family protein [Chloroflexota bacterium]